MAAARDELVASVASVDAALTLVEGAGGLSVESLGAGGVTLRDLAHHPRRALC